MGSLLVRAHSPCNGKCGLDHCGVFVFDFIEVVRINVWYALYICTYGSGSPIKSASPRFADRTQHKKCSPSRGGDAGGDDGGGENGGGNDGEGNHNGGIGGTPVGGSGDGGLASGGGDGRGGSLIGKGDNCGGNDVNGGQL